MSGRLTKLAIGLLDACARPLGRNQAEAPAHLIIGRKGEDEAYFWLRRRGYVIVARNWRSARRRGELDLVGWDGDVLCFIEVKSRTTRDVKPAETAVDAAKQRELTAMAREFLRRLPARPECRFDVISVYYHARQNTDITLFRNAFPMCNI